MITQLDFAKAGIVTEEMKKAVDGEPISAEELRVLIAGGHAVLPKNINHEFSILRAIGRNLKTKVNANIGTSGECCAIELETEKLKAALDAKTDSIMDLSTGSDLSAFRRFFLDNSPVMVGSVPIYGIAADMVARHQALDEMDGDQLLKSIEKQCREGLDYITVHCGVCQASVKKLESYQRIMPCVSRGGSIHIHWMRKNRKENPLYEYFDDLLEIAHKYDVTLSLGDGFRPGSILDATDGAQLEELMILGELARRAYDRGVQTMIEGPGHVPLAQIQSNMMLQKKLCNGAPFYILGPLPTDIGAGYDHITAAIGGGHRRGRGSGLPVLRDARRTSRTSQCPGRLRRCDGNPHSGTHRRHRQGAAGSYRAGPADVRSQAEARLGRHDPRSHRPGTGAEAAPGDGRQGSVQHVREALRREDRASDLTRHPGRITTKGVEGATPHSLKDGL